MTLKRDEFRKTSKVKFNLLWCQHCKAMQKANETVVDCYYNPLSEEGEFAFCASSVDVIDSILEAHNAVVREIFEGIEREYGIRSLQSDELLGIDMEAEDLQALKQKYGGSDGR